MAEASSSTVGSMSAHAAHRAMALDGFDAVGLRLGHEQRIQLVGARDEGHVHERAILLAGGAAEQLALIEVIVQNGGLLLVALGHSGQAAHLLQPLEHKPADVDAVGRRSVRQRLRLRLGGVAHDGGREGQHILAHQIVAHDDDGHAGGAYVLLHAAVDEAELRHVHGLGEEHRAHISDQRNVTGLGQRVVRGAVDGLVLANVHVVGLRVELEAGHVGHVGEVLVLGRGHAARLAVELRLFPGLLRPGAGHDVVGLLVLHEVHRDGRELLGGAALQEKHLVVVGNLQKLAQVGLGRLDDVREGLGAMAHLHDGHAGAVVVKHLGGRLAQHLLGKHSRTGGKVVDPSHEAILLHHAPEASAVVRPRVPQAIRPGQPSVTRPL